MATRQKQARKTRSDRISALNLIAPFSILAIIVVAQQAQPTGPATTSGTCSPAVTGSGNTINIETCGLTSEQVQEWRSSFKRILEKQIDPKVLVALLDDIKSGQIRIENGVLRIAQKVASMQYRYQPAGTKIVTKPGLITGEDGESAMFKKMVDAQAAKDGGALLRLCDGEIARVPEWLTPYAFRGIALALLGRNQEAVRQLDMFIERSADDIQFSDMRKDAVRSRDAILQAPFVRH